MGSTATVTVLMTDLVGSTRSLQLGPEAADALRQEHFAAVRAAIARHRGTEVKTTGDGIMATFTSAADGVAAAEAIQQAVDNLIRADHRHAAVRVGLSAGEATLEDGDWYGAPVIEAARLVGSDQAAGGEVLATAVVPLLVGRRGAHQFAPLGERTLKGFDDPVAVVRLDWRPLEPARVPLPPAVSISGGAFFVGRDEQQEQLAAAWKRASAGERQIVLLAGEPGIGKTRLVAELARGAHEDGALVLWGRCDEELPFPYQPFVEALRHWLAHDPDDLTARAGGDLGRLLPEMASADDDRRAAAPEDADEERLALVAAVARLLAGRSATSPIVLVLDDLHWADASSVLLLRDLVRDAEPAALLIAGTYRDTDLARTHPLSGALADFHRLPVVDRVVVRGLDRAGVETYVEAAAGAALGQEGEALARMIHAETEGNPFFIGQVLRHLTETGQLAQRDGRWGATRGIEAIGLPEGIRQVVGHRLSRLPRAPTAPSRWPR